MSSTMKSLAFGLMAIAATSLLASGCASTQAQTDEMQMMVERAEDAAARAEQAADRAEQAAEKAERIFTKKMMK